MKKLKDPRFDGDVVLSASTSTRTWAAQTRTKQGISIRKAGIFPNTAHAHELLALALANGLRAISPKHEQQLLLREGVTKARIRVLSTDPDFQQLMEEIKSSDKSAWHDHPPLKTSKYLLADLSTELKRFDVTYDIDRTVKCTVLAQWAYGSLTHERVNRPKAIAPSVVTTTGY